MDFGETMTAGSEDEFLLKWHDHHQSFFLLVEELVLREQLTDVTLACGDSVLHAHSLMLSVCSPYFRSLLTDARHNDKHHIVHLHGVAGRHMQQLLQYMYRGEISISQEDLKPLIETARCLQVKGLSMAQPNVDIVAPNPSSRKRSYSQMVGPFSDSTSSPKTKERILKKSRSSPGKAITALALLDHTLDPRSSPPPRHNLPPSPGQSEGDSMHNSSLESLDPGKEFRKESSNAVRDLATVDEAREDLQMMDSFYASNPGQTSPMSVALPLLPKPLTVLKTAETRTYLSKLIWLGNGGRRPQYGNPDTKPIWWPQHLLPWEDMKKMGGKKSEELSHINYTEILKQCLAAGYEYFGYDPATYFSSDPDPDGNNAMLVDEAYIAEDGGGQYEANNQYESQARFPGGPGEGEEEEPALEIDLDEEASPYGGVPRRDRGVLCK